MPDMFLLRLFSPKTRLLSALPHLSSYQTSVQEMTTHNLLFSRRDCTVGHSKHHPQDRAPWHRASRFSPCLLSSDRCSGEELLTQTRIFYFSSYQLRIHHK